MKRILLLIALWVCSSIVLHAQEFVYVTDSLQLRVYSQASDSSEVITTIESGDAVEIIERQSAFSRIKTYDDTEGWVKSAFLVEEPPAKLLYYSVSEENKELKTQIDALQNAAQETTVVQNNEAEKNKIKELQIALNKEQEINQKLQQQILDAGSVQPITIKSTAASIQSSVEPISNFKNRIWLLIGVPLSLIVVGFLLGLKLSSWRMRKRLHGFRLR